MCSTHKISFHWKLTTLVIILIFLVLIMVVRVVRISCFNTAWNSEVMGDESLAEGLYIKVDYRDHISLNFSFGHHFRVNFPVTEAQPQLQSCRVNDSTAG